LAVANGTRRCIERRRESEAKSISHPSKDQQLRESFVILEIRETIGWDNDFPSTHVLPLRSVERLKA